MALANARRILILGLSGAGKSTLALALGLRLGLPVIHMDAHYWNRGWVPSSDEEFRQRVAGLVEEAEWVMDGNYSSTLDLRLRRAHHVVYLESSRWRCLRQVLKRWIAFRGQQRPDMAAGCPERIDPEFIWWVLWHQPRGRPRTMARLAATPVPVTRVRAGGASQVMRDLGLG